jgi:hypothetical protein
MSATELTAPARSLPVVLRDALSADRLELLVGEVIAIPDRAHLTVEIGGAQTTVTKLSSYNASANEPCYLLADRDNVIAVGTISKAPPPTLPDLTVTGMVTAGGVTTSGLQVNGPANVTGLLTIGGLQINGGGNITADLVVSGQIVGGGVRTTANTIQATGTAVGFFGRAPIGQPAAAFSSDPAVLAPRLWTALRDLGLIQNV